MSAADGGKLAPHHRRKISEILDRTRAMPHEAAVRHVAEVVEAIVQEAVTDRANADTVKARDYRRFIIEALTLEESTERK